MEPQEIISKIQEQFPQIVVAKNRSYGMYNYVELEWSDEEYTYNTAIDVYAKSVKPYGFITQSSKKDKTAKPEKVGNLPLVDEIIKAIKKLQ